MYSFFLMYFTYYSLGWFKSIVSLRSLGIYILKLLRKKLPISGKDTPCPPPISVHILIYRCRLQVISSVQFSRSVVSNTLWPHEPQHTKPPCPSPTAGVYPNPCPLSWWCHPTILSSVVPFSSCPQSFPASGSFQMNHLFASGGQSIGVSASTSVPPVNSQDWSPLEWTGWISFQRSAFLIVQLSHPYVTTGKTIALARQTLLAKWCLCF